MGGNYDNNSEAVGAAGGPGWGGGNGTGCTKVRASRCRAVSEGWGQVKVACWALDPAPLAPLPHLSVINSLHQAGSRAGRRQVAPQSLHPLCLVAAGDKAKGRWGGWFLLVVVGSVEGGVG